MPRGTCVCAGVPVWAHMCVCVCMCVRVCLCARVISGLSIHFRILANPLNTDIIYLLIHLDFFAM